jgi:hypothetical protein
MLRPEENLGGVGKIGPHGSQLAYVLAVRVSCPVGVARKGRAHRGNEEQ